MVAIIVSDFMKPLLWETFGEKNPKHANCQLFRMLGSGHLVNVQVSPPHVNHFPRGGAIVEFLFHYTRIKWMMMFEGRRRINNRTSQLRYTRKTKLKSI